MKRLIALLALGVTCSALADQAGELKYKELMTGMEVYAAGMCDNMRNTLVEFRAADGRVAHELVALSNTRYIVIAVPGKSEPTKHYFTNKPAQKGESDAMTVLYENAMMWSTTGNPALMQESPNFFSFHFSLGRSDCALSAPLKKP